MVRVRDLQFRRRPGKGVEFDSFGLFVISGRQADAVDRAAERIRDETEDADEAVTGTVHVSGDSARITWDDPDREPLGPSEVTPGAA